MRLLTLIPVLAAVVAQVGQVAGQQFTGSYRFWICAGACSPADSTQIVARGHLVLFTDSAAAVALNSDDQARMQRAGFRQLRDQTPPNACFRFTQRQAQIGDREFYAGIISHGLTRWRYSDTELRVRLYLSPDAHYTLSGVPSGELYSGVGLQDICCGYGPPPSTRFVAERTGDADRRLCEGG